MKSKFLVLFFFICLLAGKVNAQDSIARTKTPPKRNWQIFPVIAASPETSWIFGVAAIFTFTGKDTTDRYQRVSTYSPYFVYTLRNQFLIDNQFEYFSNNGWNLSGRLKFAYFPDKFFGIGSYSDASYEQYDNKQFRFKASGRRKVGNKWFLGAALDANYDLPSEFQTGRVLDTTFVNGEDGGLLWGVGPSVTYDSRDNSIFPTKGALVRWEATFYPDGLGNDYHTNRYSMDARKYIAIGAKKQNVLALQATFAYNIGSDAPFTKIEELGGDDRLRGFHSQRYMDKAMAYAQAEYRLVIWKFIGMAAFTGIGDVYNDNWDFTNPKYNGGLGLRIQVLPGQRLNLRLDYAIGTDWQKGFYLGLREAF